MLVLLAACADLAPPPASSGQEDTATPPTAQDERVTVLSLNLHCLKQDGTPFATLDERLRVIAELVSAEGVDVLALQESCKQQGVDAQEELRLLLQTTTAAEWSTVWYQAHLAWEGTPDEASEGVGLLFRGGLPDHWVIDYVAPGELRRVALAARLAQGPVLVNTHLDYGDEHQREDQARQTATWALALAGGPEAIVAGDLNARVGSPTRPTSIPSASTTSSCTAARRGSLWNRHWC